MTPNIGETLYTSLNRGFYTAAAFIPNFIAGIVILLIGVILGSIIKRIVLEVFRALKLETYLRKYGVPEGKRELNWANILAEIARWFVIILFLIPTTDVWNLPRVVIVLQEFLLYLPNIFVAAIIGLIGMVFAKLAYDIVLASTRDLSPDASQAIASVTRVAIIVFVILVALQQLGIAKELITTLFQGIVAMLALAGGIAFGLGGQETARDLLSRIRKDLHQKPPTKK